MNRIAILDSTDFETLRDHLDVSESQVSSVFGGKVNFTWEQYEVELRQYCADNQERLTWLPPRDKKGKFLKDGDDYSYYSESQSQSMSHISEEGSGSQTGEKKKAKGRLALGLSSSKKK